MGFHPPLLITPGYLYLASQKESLNKEVIKKIEAFQFTEQDFFLWQNVSGSGAQMVNTAHLDRYSLVVFQNSDTGRERRMDVSNFPSVALGRCASGLN